MWDVADHEEFSCNYQTKSPMQWCRTGIWGTRQSSDNDVELWQISSPDVEGKGWDRLDFFPEPTFRIDDTFIKNALPKALDLIKRSPNPTNSLVLKTVTTSVIISSIARSEWSSAVAIYSSYDFVDDNLVAEVKFPSAWQHKAGREVQVIITGSYFYGPDPRWPDKTDEMDPKIDCLVVEEVRGGQLERLVSFVGHFSRMKKLEWTPTIAILR